MKMLLLLLFACNAFIAAQAQNNPTSLQKLKQKIAELKERQGFSVNTVRVDTVKQFSDLALLSAKPGVYRLPQDNMPCLVPNTEAIAAIPNAWKGEIKTPYTPISPHMPNPAKPLIVSPSRPLIASPDTK